jgi:hypothetical protein
MRLPLPPGFVDEAGALALRSGCPHCFHRLADGRCGNGWPLEGQERIPPVVEDAGGPVAVFCREFELR